MKQYHFDRDDFVKVFEEVFGDDLDNFLDGTLGESEEFFSYKVDGFKCFMVEWLVIALRLTLNRFLKLIALRHKGKFYKGKKKLWIN